MDSTFLCPVKQAPNSKSTVQFRRIEYNHNLITAYNEHKYK